MALSRSLWISVVLVAACGGKSHPVCPSEKHLADPDGRGERCVDDQSTCEAPDDCIGEDACCTAACADPDGTGVYRCEQTCRSPDCTADNCHVDWRCQVLPDDACLAFCVPADLQCPEGQIAADPSGTGVYQCVAVESDCLRPADCPGSADGCCVGVCREQFGNVWGCEEDCVAYGAGSESGADRDWMCFSNVDCESMMGEPGWTCAELCGGNECIPPRPECDSDDDCVLAQDLSLCCGDCQWAYTWAEVEANPCLALWAEADPQPEPDDGGAPAPPDDPPQCEPQCGGVECPDIDCDMPSGVTCSLGQCVPY